MKILVYGINYYPEKTGIGKYTGEMVEWLVEQEHQVCVVTAPPYYPDWKVAREYFPWFYKKECIHNALVYRCPLWVPKQPNGFQRILHHVSFALSSFPAALFLSLSFKPDVILVIEPPIMCAPTALFIGNLLNAKTWLHVQDFEVDAAFSLGLLRVKKIFEILLKIESFLMSKFNLVSTISENMHTQLNLSKGVDSRKTNIFPNWVDTNKIYPLNKANNFREKLEINESACIVLYSGSIGAKQGLEILVSAARILEEQSDIVFVVCGAGSYKAELLSLAAGLKNIIFIDLQPIEELNELLNMADIHILPQKSNAADLVMPSKIQAIFSSGKPVVVTAKQETQLAKVVQGRGIVVEPEEVNTLTNALIYLAENPEQRNILGAKAREYAIKMWDKGSILRCFEKKLIELNSEFNELNHLRDESSKSSEIEIKATTTK